MCALTQSSCTFLLTSCFCFSSLCTRNSIKHRPTKLLKDTDRRRRRTTHLSSNANITGPQYLHIIIIIIILNTFTKHSKYFFLFCNFGVLCAGWGGEMNLMQFKMSLTHNQMWKTWKGLNTVYKVYLHLFLHRYQGWRDYSRQTVYSNRSGMPGCLCECSNGPDQWQLLCECLTSFCRWPPFWTL